MKYLKRERGDDEDVNREISNYPLNTRIKEKGGED